MTSAADVSANDALGQVRIGPGAVFAEGTTVAGERVELASGASVFDVLSDQLSTDAGADVRGDVGSVSLPLVSPYCELSALLECGGDEISVAKGQTSIPLAAGTYGRIRVRRGATLVLAGGAYRFCSLTVAGGGRLLVAASQMANVVVAGHLKLAGGAYVGAAASGPLPRIDVAGGRIRLRHGSELAAFVRAPDARLRTADSVTMRGSYCTLQLTVGGASELACAVPVCGDGVVEEPAEQCDGDEDAACENRCRSDCTCGEAWHFTEVSAAAGIDARYQADYAGLGALEFELLVTSGGVAAGDYDNDGWIDLYTVGGELGQDHLYRNRGDGTFEDVAASAGVAQVGVRSNGPVFADYDGDGWLDLLVGGSLADTNKLFHNDGDGTFTAVDTDDDATTGAFSLSEPSAFGAFSSSLGDYDGDGDLDVFMSHWGSNEILGPPAEHLWRNEGDGTFSPATASAGLDLFDPGGFGFTWTYTGNFSDVDGDGLPDLLVASDFGTEQYFLNDGDGTFTEATSAVNSSENGMGSAIGDYDNDGDLDWFVTSVFDPNGVAEGNWGVTGNRMYRNRGDGTFEDATDETGVRIGYWGWGACFADFDLDGHLDLFHVNGFDAGVGVTAEFHADPSLLYVANGDGTFTDRAAELSLVDTGDGRGVVCFDYDRDGDVDIFVANGEGQPARLYRNDGDMHGSFLQVRLVGHAPNREAIGAKVYATVADVTQMREIRAGSNFLSQDPALAHFGCGVASQVDRLRIVWPDASETILTDVATGQFLVLVQPE